MCIPKNLKEFGKPGKDSEKASGNPGLSLLFSHEPYFLPQRKVYMYTVAINQEIKKFFKNFRESQDFFFN